MSEAMREFVGQLKGRESWLLHELDGVKQALAKAEHMLNGNGAVKHKAVKPAKQQAAKWGQPVQQKKKYVPTGKIGKPRSQIIEEAVAFRERMVSVLSNRRTWMTKKAMHLLMERTSSSYFNGSRSPYAKVADAIRVLIKEGVLKRNGAYYGMESFAPYDSDENIAAMRALKLEQSRRRSASSTRGWNKRASGNGEGVVAG